VDLVHRLQLAAIFAVVEIGPPNGQEGLGILPTHRLAGEVNDARPVHRGAYSKIGTRIAEQVHLVAPGPVLATCEMCEPPGLRAPAEIEQMDVAIRIRGDVARAAPSGLVASPGELLGGLEFFPAFQLACVGAAHPLFPLRAVDSLPTEDV